MLCGIAQELVTAAAVFYLPAANAVFWTAPIPAGVWLMLVPSGILLSAAEEAGKVVARRPRAGRAT